MLTFITILAFALLGVIKCGDAMRHSTDLEQPFRTFKQHMHEENYKYHHQRHQHNQHHHQNHKISPKFTRKTALSLLESASSTTIRGPEAEKMIVPGLLRFLIYLKSSMGASNDPFFGQDMAQVSVCHYILSNLV